MKSLIDLYVEVAIDMATWCRTSADSDESVETELRRDAEYITARVEHEGVSFLTISLPAFARDFERALDQGAVSDDLFLGFERISKRAKLPSFLRWFTRLVFDPTSGRLLDNAKPDAIWAVRQMAGLFGKILLPCTPAREEAALAKYVECEKEVELTNRRLLDDVYCLSSFRRVGGMLFNSVLADLDGLIYHGRLVPKHGPGATADKLLGNQKWTQSEWTERLESVFPALDYLIPSPRFFSDLETVDFLEPGEERPVRVVLVPKTLKTPRVIAIEPTCMQYTQQAIAVALVELIEKSSVSSMIGFTNQSPNQTMARVGSFSGNLATLDLSEASDRVSNLLVETMLARFPHLFDAVQACRSQSADVPGYGVIPLSKFASMGSALCFPVEAMVFLTIVFMGIEDALNRPLTMWDIQSMHGSVRVYGDDIIVPVNMVPSVYASLEAFGLKVNARKSFWSGSFRESCGKEYYAGHDVSIVKVRRVLPSKRTDVEEIISAVATRNLMYEHGLWRAARWMDQRLERILRYYPDVGASSPLLGRQSFIHGQQPVRRFCKYLHVPLEKGYRVRAPLPKNEINGGAALLKWFTKQSEEPFADVDHLTRSGRPRVVDIKLGLASTY